LQNKFIDWLRDLSLSKKLRDLIRFEVSLCFICRKVYQERGETPEYPMRQKNLK
jgi:hypothetical protein